MFLAPYSKEVPTADVAFVQMALHFWKTRDGLSHVALQRCISRRPPPKKNIETTKELGLLEDQGRRGLLLDGPPRQGSTDMPLHQGHRLGFLLGGPRTSASTASGPWGGENGHLLVL